MDHLKLTGAEQARWLDWIDGILHERPETSLQGVLSDMFSAEQITATSLILRVEKHVS